MQEEDLEIWRDMEVKGEKLLTKYEVVGPFLVV